MDASPCWLLTDSLGQTAVGAASWFRWGRGVTHSVWTHTICGYCADSVHLPFLLDPLYERYGTGARLWLSEVDDVRYDDPVRISSNTWTTLDEWERPRWIETEAEMRVRLRFALLAAATAHPAREAASRLRTLSLKDIRAAGRQVEQACAESRHSGAVPQAACLAAMAVRSAAALLEGSPRLVDLVSRHYPVYAWYAGMAAACACANLSELADEAVRCEHDEALAPVMAATVAAL